MSDARDRMLATIRQAVIDGNRAGSVGALEARGTTGYQGAGADPVSRFAQEFTAAGAVFHRAADAANALELILALLKGKEAAPVLLGRGRSLDALSLEEVLRSHGHTLLLVDQLADAAAREAFFAAGVGISGADFLIAETGSIVLDSRRDQPRSLTLLPPLHIVVAEDVQLVPDLFDLFASRSGPDRLPACVSIITGPSKTGDIELRLVTGVHGPGEIHLILIAQGSG